MTYYHDNDDVDAYLLLSIWRVEISVIEHSDGFYPWMIHDEFAGFSKTKIDGQMMEW